MLHLIFVQPKRLLVVQIGDLYAAIWEFREASKPEEDKNAKV